VKNIDRNIIYLGFVSFFTDMASSMITIVLPLFVVYVLQEGVDKLGVVIAIATFVSYAFRILFGYLSDRLQVVKPFVVAGYLISAFSKPLLAFSSSYVSVSLLRGVERMGKAVRSAPKDLLISSYAKTAQDGRTFGFHKMLDIAGELSGAVLIFVLFYVVAVEESTIRSVFLWTLLPGAVALMIVLFLVKDVPSVPRKKTIVVNRADYRHLWLLGCYFFFMFFLFSDQYFIVMVKEAGYPFSSIPLFVIVLTLTQTLMSYYSGVISDRWGSERVLIVAFLFGLLSMFALWQGLFWLAFLLLALNAIRSYISREAKSRGFLYGIFYGGVAVSASLGALLMGYIWEHYGVQKAIFVSITGLVHPMLFLSVLIMKKRVGREAK
jgi:MFS family permease